MTRSIWNRVCAAGGCAFLIGQFLAPIPAVAQQDRAVDSGRVVLAGNRNPRVTAENDRGVVNPGKLISGISLVFKRSQAQAAELRNLLQEQQNASSPNYHRWLTPEQYANRFGLASTEVARVISWLEGAGFRVDYNSRSRTWLTFSGTAAQVQSAFHSEIHSYETNGTAHFANASDPSIPASLAPLILTIRGLDDFRTEPRKPKLKPLPNFTGPGGLHYLTPGDLGTIYDINALYHNGFSGAGQKIVVAGQTEIYLSDLQSFRSLYALPSNNPELVLAAGSLDPGVSPDDLIESSLDLEYAGGVAPSATLIFVYAINVWNSVAYAIDQNLAPVISSSYGYCEPEVSGSPTSTGAYFQMLAEQANALGITWLAASGDWGAAGCDTGRGIRAASHGLAVFLPASVPEITALGGTEFNEGSGNYWSTINTANGDSALSYIPEKAWNDTAVNITAGDGLAATGGGASILFTKPAWQTGSGVPADGARDVPDLSFAAANDHDPYTIYANGALSYIGGTSVSTPIFAGILGLLNQYLLSNGTLTEPGLGNINPTLYRLAQTTSGVFHDITIGNNIVPCQTGSPNCVSGHLGYNAGAGYDQTTGLGSADVYNLVTEWAASVAAPSATAVIADPTSISSTGSTVLTATVSADSGTSSPSGPVSFVDGSTMLGSSQLSGSGGNATANLTVSAAELSIGSNVISAFYGGSAAFLGSSAPVTVTVTACTYSLTSNLDSVGSGAGEGTTSVMTAGNCAWTASSNVSWLTISSGASGTGNGTVDFSFAANPGSSARSGVLTIGGQSFTVTQSATPSALAFYALAPCRIADTRSSGGSGLTGAFGPPSLTGGTARSFPVQSSACNVPATAQAYALNFTVVPAGPLDYLTTWPTGLAQPLVSTLNDVTGKIVANAAMVQAGTRGSIDVFVNDTTDLIIDINGYFAPPGQSQALAFYALAPCRVADTRNTNGAFGGPEISAQQTRSFPLRDSSCGIPASAEAYSLNLTVVPPGPLAFLSTWPTGQAQPSVSTLNDLDGDIVANAALVQAGTNGAVNVFAYDASNVIIDTNGYFAPSGSSGALNFYPLTPCRIADTRSSPSGTFAGPALSAGETRSFPVPASSCHVPANAQAYSLNLTVVPPGPLMYLLAWPAGQTQPLTSTLNDVSGDIVANAAIVAAGSSGAVDVYASDATNVVLDINGYFAP